MKRMLHISILIIFVLSSMMVAVACGSDTAEAPTTAPTSEVTPSQPETAPEPEPVKSSDPYEIQITNKGLIPKTLTVPVGTKVTWYNNDDRENARHWFKSTTGSFNTRAIPKTSRMSVTFNEVGVHEYSCMFHKDREEEKGTIIVVE